MIGDAPVSEQTVTTIHRAIVKGSYLSETQRRPALIGERLAKLLQVGLDDSLVLLVQAADGSMGGEKYRVTGIFRSGSPELDRGLVYLLDRDARSLFALEGRQTEAVILLGSSHEVASARQELSAALEPAG